MRNFIRPAAWAVATALNAAFVWGTDAPLIACVAFWLIVGVVWAKVDAWLEAVQPVKPD